MTARPGLQPESTDRTGWHARVVALGRWRSVLLLTGFSVFASVVLTGIGLEMLDIPRADHWKGYLIAALVPAIVAPLATATITGLVFELERMRSALHQVAIRDGLTQAHNRHHFLEQLPLEVHRAQRAGQPLSLLMLDADHFKSVNDQHGHATGDEVLRRIAGLCRSMLRPYDLLVRYGGEEFVMLLIGVGLGPARDVAERLRASIAETPMKTSAGADLQVTVSIGVAELQAGESGGEAMLERADAALYEAKRAGRNRCA